MSPAMAASACAAGSLSLHYPVTRAGSGAGMIIYLKDVPRSIALQARSLLEAAGATTRIV